MPKGVARELPKMMSEDSIDLQKQLENKQYVISDLKAIHVVPREVSMNIRNENHELKVDIDGLNSEMDQVKRETHDLKKDKKKVDFARDEVMMKWDGRTNKDKKRLEYVIADLLKVGEFPRAS
mgnify:CR=1 FL=1